MFMLSVNRESIWRDAFMFYKGQIDAIQPLQVEFTGDSEMGIDGGGPRREFFQLPVHHLTSTTAGFFIVTQNAESCLIYCQADMVPDIGTRYYN